MVDELGVEEFLKLVRQELAGVVRVEVSDDAHWGRFAGARERVEVGDVLANGTWRVRLFGEVVHSDEARVVVDEHEHVLL